MLNRAQRRSGKFLTPDDLVNPNCKSGYDYVRYVNDSRRKIDSVPYMAQEGSGNTHGSKDANRKTRWVGPRRATALEAAQDYCDYINGQLLKPIFNNFDAPTVDMGTTVHIKAQSSVVIKREEFKGPHDLYDVILYDAETGQVFRRKVGITARGEKRYADIAATFGFSIKPYGKAVTYSTKEAARAAELLKVQEVQKDPEWRQVGKECFAPAVKGK